MPRIALTDRFVANSKAKAQTDFFDEKCRGLSLRVSPKSKTWTFHYRWNGKRARATLGTYPATSLGEARARAIEAKGNVEANIDPRFRAQGAMTIAALVDSYVEKHAASLRTGKEIERRLKRNIVSVIGDVPLADVHRRDATRVVDRILRRGAPIEAMRAFEDLRAMLKWAVSRGDLDHNPIEGMKKPPGSKPRTRVLTDDEIKVLWSALPTALAKSAICQRIIKLCLVTGQRVGEIAGMSQDELDLKRKVWNLPGSRTKNGHPHSVPLSDLALAIIGEGNGSITAMAVAKTIARAQDRIGLAPFTAHDLRRTALTKLAELGVAPIILGHIANHRTTTKAGITLGVYVQHAYEREKREALELWADRLHGIVSGGADVVSIGAKR